MERKSLKEAIKFSRVLEDYSFCNPLINIMGVRRISTRGGVFTEKHQVLISIQYKILLICHKNLHIAVTSIKRTITPMRFSLFTSEEWTCQIVYIYICNVLLYSYLETSLSRHRDLSSLPAVVLWNSRYILILFVMLLKVVMSRLTPLEIRGVEYCQLTTQVVDRQFFIEEL